MEEVDEQELHVERVAALDLGKAALEVCVRVPHQTKPGRRLQEVRTYQTMTRWLLVPKTFRRDSTTIQSSTPSVRVAMKIPGAPVPSRSVQNGASTLFGRAGLGPFGSVQHWLSSEVPPPATR